MADKSKIEWTQATWNPVTGCTKVSPGCDNCYAETFAERWRGTPGHAYERGFDVTLRPERLDQPLRWTKPRLVFVNSMSDLFHDAIAEDFIARVFAVMALARQHTFQLLTKRHGRMHAVLNKHSFWAQVGIAALEMTDDKVWLPAVGISLEAHALPNVWGGVSVEDQKRAELRISALIDTPFAVRWLSCEPLLGPIALPDYVVAGDPDCPCQNGADCRPNIDWVVVGGESGPGARPMHPDWARALRDQCNTGGIPLFFKQQGQYAPVADKPTAGDLWLAADGAAAEWKHGDGHIRSAGGDFRWPGTNTVLVRRHRSKHDAGRLLDGQAWEQYPAGAVAVPA